MPTVKLTARPVLPPLPEAEYGELRESIKENGILTPLLAVPDGTLIDGHERLRVIGEIGPKKYPVRLIVVADEPERVMLAFRCNAERRHLTRAQRQELLRTVIVSAPEKSER
jgi:ParB-like chromosome segregation protein Spo0J